MKLELTLTARRYIADRGLDHIYAARPVRRFIAQEVETRIGRALLAGDARDGAVIVVDCFRARSDRELQEPGTRADRPHLAPFCVKRPSGAGFYAWLWRVREVTCPKSWCGDASRPRWI